MRPESSPSRKGAGHTGLFTEEDLTEEKVGIWEASYEGERNEKNQRHGFGLFTNPRNGNVYEGKYKFDKKQGRGKMAYHLSGDTYDGSWTDNKKNGFGRYEGANGSLHSRRWQ